MMPRTGAVPTLHRPPLWVQSKPASLPSPHPPRLTGELRSQIDRIWDSFWSGGISNPMEVLEQITYLLFMRRLDELHTLAENKAIRAVSSGVPMSTLTIRLPDDKHERLKALARANAVSVNKLIDELATVALANFDARVRFETRAARGSASRALSLLDKLDRAG